MKWQLKKKTQCYILVILPAHYHNSSLSITIMTKMIHSRLVKFQSAQWAPSTRSLILYRKDHHGRENISRSYFSLSLFLPIICIDVFSESVSFIKSFARLIGASNRFSKLSRIDKSLDTHIFQHVANKAGLRCYMYLPQWISKLPKIQTSQSRFQHGVSSSCKLCRCVTPHTLILEKT